MLDWIKNEPVIAARLADLVVAAVVAALLHYGVMLTPELKVALAGFIVAALAGATVKARKASTPNSKL
jgi:hypothetical protein